MSLLALLDFIKVVIKRYRDKKADTFVVIYGLARTGKTTLGFKILLRYLRLKRRLYKEGKSSWKIEGRWSKLFKKYFGTTAEDVNYKIKHNPDGSFNFIDEGLDVASWHERMTKEQKDLLVLVQKTGKKGQLTILITPSFSILTKDILARAHYLFIIPDEPSKHGNIAFLFRQYKVPFLAEKNPFGLNKMLKDLRKHPTLFDETRKFVSYLRRQKRLVGTIRFGKISDKVYNLYDKMVKEPSIMKEERKRKMVSYGRYKKLKYTLDTILFNLYTHPKFMIKIATLERLATDKFGTKLLSRHLIRGHIDKMTALRVKPALTDEEIIELPIIIKPEEDVDLSLSLEEELKSHVNTVDKSEESKEKVNAG